MQKIVFNLTEEIIIGIINVYDMCIAIPWAKHSIIFASVRLLASIMSTVSSDLSII